jgi:hypothetical protein
MSDDLTPEEETELRERFMKLGFNYHVAEALVQRGVGETESLNLSKDTILNHFLEWNGIIGYTDMIRDAVFNIQSTGTTEAMSYADRAW